MIKALVLSALVFGHLLGNAAMVFERVQCFYKQTILRVCDDVDPGDEDHFE